MNLPSSASEPQAHLEPLSLQPDPRRGEPGWRRAQRVTSDLLPLADTVAILGTAALVASFLPIGGVGLLPVAWVAAALGLFVLYDPDFGRSEMRRGPTLAVHTARFLGLAAGLLALAAASRLLRSPPLAIVGLWLGLAWALTVLWRMAALARLKRAGSPPLSTPPGERVRSLQKVGGVVAVEVLAERPMAPGKARLKDAEDLLIGGVLTLLLLPLLAVIALAIKLDSPGPVLFKQRRHALNNDEFDIYKFRSMRTTTAGPGSPLQQTRRGDPRVTRVGRFLRASSLDELPQLFNVLRGQMSLVGPRPHATDMRTEDRLGVEITPDYAHRHRVKPGITGWAQVNGARGATDTTDQLQRRIDLDLEYISRWSLWLDFKILLLTVRTVLGARNAF